jgi:hypothetical protein
MAAPEVPHPTPGKGKHKPAADGKKAGKGLNKKLGPLPVWGWGVGLVLAIVVGVYLRKHSGGSQTSDQTATPAADQGSGSGGGGAAPLPASTVDTTPLPLPPDFFGSFPSDQWPWTDTPIEDVPADTGTVAPVWGTDSPLALIYQGDPINQGNLAPLSVTPAQKRSLITEGLSHQPDAATAAGALGAFGIRSIGRIPIVTIRPPAPHREAPHATALHSRSVRSAISLGEHSRRDRESPGRSRHAQPVRHTQAHPSAGYSGYATGHTYSAPHHVSPPAKSRTGGAGRTYAI